jgi:hypothetical protein
MFFDTNELAFLADYARQILTIYAAIISTYVLYLLVRQTRPNIKVTAEKSQDRGFSENMIIITAQNNGKKPATVTVFGIITPDGKKIIVPPSRKEISRPELPARLREGEVCTGFFNLDENLPTLFQFGDKIIIQGFFRDIEKRDFSSLPLEIQLPTLPENVKILQRPH